MFNMPVIRLAGVSGKAVPGTRREAISVIDAIVLNDPLIMISLVMSIDVGGASFIKLNGPKSTLIALLMRRMARDQ